MFKLVGMIVHTRSPCLMKAVEVKLRAPFVLPLTIFWLFNLMKAFRKYGIQQEESLAVEAKLLRKQFISSHLSVKQILKSI